MEAVRKCLNKRKRYIPPKPVLPWVPACEYQFVIIVALISMIGAYFALLGTIFQYFFGIFNKRAIDVMHYSNETGVQLMDEYDSYLDIQNRDDETDQEGPPVEPPPSGEGPPVEPPPSGGGPPVEPPPSGGGPSVAPPPTGGEVPAGSGNLKPPKNFEYRAYHCNMHLVINGIIPVLISQGILMFRVWCCYNRKVVKLLHVIILGITLPLSVIGLTFMPSWSNYLPPPLYKEHFWSLHAWLGIVFFVLFVVTFVSGLYVFYWKSYKDPYGSAELRSKFVPYHSFMGLAIFIITVSQVVTGLTNYASAFMWDTWEASSMYDYHYYEHDYLRRTFSVKLCLVLYILSAATVMYALSRDDFRHRGRIILTKDTEWTDMVK